MRVPLAAQVYPHCGRDIDIGLTNTKAKIEAMRERQRKWLFFGGILAVLMAIGAIAPTWSSVALEPADSSLGDNRG
jgi:hypothetical protein